MAALDINLLKALYAGTGSPAWVTAVIAVSFLGSGWMLLALLPPLVVGPRRGLAAAALATLVVTSGAVTLLKLVTARVRPCHALAWAHEHDIAQMNLFDRELDFGATAQHTRARRLQ